jgi:signal peptidase I
MTTPRPSSRPRKRPLRSLLEAAAVAYLVVTFGITTVGISGDSMAPTLRHGERAFVPKYEVWLRRLGIGEYHRGDIVYFRPPDGVTGTGPRIPVLGLALRPFYIKRIVGLPGERLRIDRGVVYIDGNALDEPYLAGGWRGSSSMNEILIPPGHVFVLGDNRGPLGSVDSRRFGPIPLQHIAGRASAVIWPLMTEEGDTWHWNARALGDSNAFARQPPVEP